MKLKRLMTNPGRNRGITLIELMAVIVVVAVLGSFAVSSYRGYLMRTNCTEAKMALLRVQAAQEKFFLQQNAYASALAAARVFKPEYRDPIFAIYGFVRVADEIVDTFHSHDKEQLLNKFIDDTWEAINIRISTNPVLHAFQKVVNEYHIDRKLISAFLESMEMDLTRSSYNRENYDKYIYGSAEVVGLMCLKVFLDGDEKKYKELEHSARMLGAAFQKVNFLRDIQSDLNDRGRIYLPGVHHLDFIDNNNKAQLEKEVENEFKEAFKGIVKLPISSAL